MRKWVWGLRWNFLSNIKGKLQPYPNHDLMFKNSVFGPWLDTPQSPNNNHLLKYVLQHQVYVPQLSIECPPIIYNFGNHELHFGHLEFSLVTRFRCGKLL